MEYLEESIEKLRKENEFERKEIHSYLDQLIQVQDNKNYFMFDKSSKNNYITELCKYEQQINHKLTEIKFELKKFIALNKPPICKPTRKKSDVDPIDIETLKRNSLRLISKLQEYSAKDENSLERTYIGAMSPHFTQSCNSDDVQYPYVSESTMETLSDHTKCMLKDLPTSKNINYYPVKIEEISRTYCGHFPEIEGKFPDISRSCSKSSILTPNSDIPKNSEDSLLLKSLNENGIRLIDNSDNEISSEPDKKINSFLENTSKYLKIDLDYFELNKENCLIDLEDEAPTFSEMINENLECINISSKKSCFTKYSEVQEIEHAEAENCKNLSKSGDEDGSLIDLGDAPNISEIVDDKFKTPETSVLDLKSTNYSSIVKEEIMSTVQVSDSAENDKMQEKSIELLETFKFADIFSPMKLNNELSVTDNDNDSSSIQFNNVVQFETDQGSSLQSETEDIISNAHIKEVHVSKNEDLKDSQRLQNNLAEDNLKSSSSSLPLDEQQSSEISIPEETKLASTHENVKDCNLNANSGKSLYSAQEKIMKLGLDDRMARFEKTRHVASLPDLRLQPSVTDNEKMDQILNQGVKFEIKAKEIGNLYSSCIFSHVESPFEFYIHLDDEESKLIDCLNDLITQHFRKTTTPYRSKFEAFEKIGKFCCAYVIGDKTYYRAEVVDWLFEKDTKIVLVQLVDYGNITLVHYKHLRELTKEFSILPKLAVKCYLPMLYPPGSTKANLLNKWPVTTIEALRELGGLCESDIKIFYKIFYIHKEGDFTGVDMYEEGNNELDSVGQLLIDLGHAVQIVLPSDDPMGVVSDDMDIERLEACSNINEVVLGYDPKDEGRICKFTRKDGTCFKGKNCKLEHLQFLRGGFTTDHTLTFCSAMNEIKLPQVAECVAIRFTVFLEASHYYINLMQFADALVSLEKTMNDKKNCASYQQYKIMPAYGEIVLVNHWSKRWLRGKVRHHSYDEEGNCAGVQVFMVDYGDIIDVPLKDIRQINPEFLELPFQAVECILHNYKTRNDVDLKDMDKFFYDNMFFREFVGKVMGRSVILLLKVFHKNRDIGKILTQRGFLTEVCSHIFPSNDSIVLPG